MSLDAPESAHHAVSEFLYSAILLLWAQMMAYDTEWREFIRNLAETVVYDCALFIVASCVLRLILRRFCSTLVGVLANVALRGTTEYVLMEFIVLLLTIYYITGSSSDS